MSKVYLDNNIFGDIERGLLSIDFLQSQFPNCIFYFSQVHIEEAPNSTPKDIETRLLTITSLTKNNCLFYDLESDVIFERTIEPKTLFENSNDELGNYANSLISVIANLFTGEQKRKIRESIGLDPAKVNNYKKEEILAVFDKKIREFGNMTLIEMFEYTDQFFRPIRNPMQTQITKIFELLDMFGFWKDKQTSKSNVARLRDSEHCFYATYCDYFVTNDKRTQVKSEVVYDYYKHDTEVIELKSPLNSGE